MIERGMRVQDPRESLCQAQLVVGETGEREGRGPTFDRLQSQLNPSMKASFSVRASLLRKRVDLGPCIQLCILQRQTDRAFLTLQGLYAVDARSPARSQLFIPFPLRSPALSLPGTVEHSRS